MTGVTGATRMTAEPLLDADTIRTSMQASPKKQRDENSATTSDHGNAQGAASNCPTGGGREVTSAVPLTHDEIEQATNDRLSSDPDYQKLLARQAELAQAEIDFALVDGHTLGQDDQIIDMAALRALAGDTGADAGARAAAQRLLNNVALWNELATGLDGKNDNRVGSHDVSRLKAANADELKAHRATTKAEIKAEDAARVGAAATAAGAAGTGQAGSTSQTPADPKGVMAEADQALPKPAPSQFSGLEGASENLNNMVGWAEAETDRLTKLMGKTDDPAVLKQLETKINQMSRRMQQMTALMNQIMTAMQNISKMYSDIAMNSVRNMR